MQAPEGVVDGAPARARVESHAVPLTRLEERVVAGGQLFAAWAGFVIVVPVAYRLVAPSIGIWVTVALASAGMWVLVRFSISRLITGGKVVRSLFIPIVPLFIVSFLGACGSEVLRAL